MELSTANSFARRWEVSAKHGEIPSAYIKVYQNRDIKIYLSIPYRINLPKSATKDFGVEDWLFDF